MADGGKGWPEFVAIVCGVYLELKMKRAEGWWGGQSRCEKVFIILVRGSSSLAVEVIALIGGNNLRLYMPSRAWKRGDSLEAPFSCGSSFWYMLDALEKPLCAQSLQKFLILWDEKLGSSLLEPCKMVNIGICRRNLVIKWQTCAPLVRGEVTFMSSFRELQMELVCRDRGKLSFYFIFEKDWLYF